MVRGLLLILLHADLLTTSAGSSRSRRQNGEMKGSDYYMEHVKDEIKEGTWTTWTKDNGMMKATWTENDNGMMKASWTENDNGMMKATWTEKDGMMEEMDYDIKPVLTVVVNKTEFVRAHKKSEVKITNTFKPRPGWEESPWVQVNDDSKASTKTNTIAEITYKTWIKENNIDCATRMPECMKALVDIKNILKA